MKLNAKEIRSGVGQRQIKTVQVFVRKEERNYGRVWVERGADKRVC